MAAGIQTDLDVLGIAKNARDEKIAARKKKDLTPEELRHHAEMEKLYRQQVLKEQPGVPVLQIQGLKKGRAGHDDALAGIDSKVPLYADSGPGRNCRPFLFSPNKA